MMALLAFLTSLNFMLYNYDGPAKQGATLNTAGNSPGASGQNATLPDEKVPDNPNSISEEYLHEPEALLTLPLTISHTFPFLHSTALLTRAPSRVSPPPDHCNAV